MAKCIIGFGKCSRYYLYILYSMCCYFLYFIMFDFSLFDSDSKKGILFFIPVINAHFLIKCLYKYLGFIVFSILLIYFDRNNERKSIKEKITKSFNYELIYNEENAINSKDKIQIIIICIIYPIFLESVNMLYLFGFYNLDFWITNIIFTSYFMKVYYKITEYSHQKFSLYLCVFINFIILIISSFLPFKSNVYHTTEKSFNSKYYCFIIIIIFLLDSCLISFVRVKTKILMDIKYISPYKIMLFIGIFGFLISIICLIFTSIFKCKSNFNCMIKNNDDEYLDSLPLYFSNMNKRLKSDKPTFFAEIFVLYPLTSFLIFLKYLIEILLIFYLNPIYVLISDNFYYGLVYIINFICEYNEDNRDKLIQQILLILSDILSSILFFVYLEVIELRFCELDKNLRINIDKRGKMEIIQKEFGDNCNIFDNSFEEESEEEEKIGEIEIKKI